MPRNVRENTVLVGPSIRTGNQQRMTPNPLQPGQVLPTSQVDPTTGLPIPTGPVDPQPQVVQPDGSTLPQLPPLGAPFAGGLQSLIDTNIAQRGNSFQNQGGTQNSQFGSQGSTQQQQTNNTTGNTNSVATQNSNVNTTGSENQNLAEQLTQATTQDQQSTQGQTGRVTAGVNDTLGLSNLISSDAQQAGVNEAARSGFLTDLVQNGPSGLDQNVEAAINRAVSGPGMSGVGNEALGRVAGSAAADVARNATAQQLQGAQQLAGPTASSSVVAAGTPLLDRTQDTSQQVITNAVNTTQQDQNRNLGSNTQTANNQVGNTTNNTNQNTTQASIADLLLNQQEQGTQNAVFNQLGASVQPASGGGGGCCFLFLEARYGDGTMDKVVRRFRDEHMTDKNKRGYYKLSEVLVPLMRKSKIIKKLVQVTMTSPLVSYGKFYYGEGCIGQIFTPVKSFWLGLFDYLGGDHKFVRENGEVI